MDLWVMYHRLNMQAPRWHNVENHLMIGPKTGFTSNLSFYEIITGIV